jgi:hypothetical protein
MAGLIAFLFLPRWSIQMKTIIIVLAWSFAFQIQAASADGWTSAAPRQEIRPQFQDEKSGGKSGHGAFAIRAVRLLENTDADGVFDKATMLAD